MPLIATRGSSRGSPLTAAFTSPPRSNLIFRFLQNKTRIQIWLFENTELRIEGKIIGFDEYMNLVLDDAEELSLKQKTRKPLGAPRRPRTLRSSPLPPPQHRRRRRCRRRRRHHRTRNSAEHARPALAQGGSCSKATTSR